MTSTFFDPQASHLHVSGTVIKKNAHVNTGQYHTLDLELHRPFTLLKPYGWDSVATQTLRESLRQNRGDDLAAVVMQEGLANICVITEFRTILKQRVEHGGPGRKSGSGSDSAKRNGAKGDNAAKPFFEKTLSTLLRAVEFDVSKPRPLLLASPGWVASEFKQYIEDQGQRKLDKTLLSMAREAVVVQCSGGHVHNLNEVLKSPEVQKTMKDKKFSTETRLLDEFDKRLRLDDYRVCYGLEPVVRAIDEGAVGAGGGTLLINNSLFRNMDIATRKKYVALVDKVKEGGGEAKVLSSDHESGQRLDKLGGIAAILTFPLYDLDDSDDEAGGGEPGSSAAGTSVI